jgi:hypothetical protein
MFQNNSDFHQGLFLFMITKFIVLRLLCNFLNSKRSLRTTFTPLTTNQIHNLSMEITFEPKRTWFHPGECMVTDVLAVRSWLCSGLLRCVVW